ncbi:MAG TPA: hypothetical protein VF008_26085, partial [Niastella sp.]
MNKAYITSYIILVLGIAALPACNKLIEIDPPVNEITSELVFKTDATAKAALSGMYSQLCAATTQNFYLTAYTSLGADELEYLGVATSYDDVRNNAMISTSQA